MGREKWDEKSGGKISGVRKVGHEKRGEESGVREQWSQEKWDEKSGARKVGCD